MPDLGKTRRGKRTAKKAAKNKGGRPEFEPTKEDREQVEILICARQSEDDIARVLGINRKTLVKHFGEEILTGQAKRRAAVIMAQYRSAVAGNVSAQDKFLKASDAPPQASAPKAETLGKKGQAQRDAEAAGVGSEWGEDLQVASSARLN